MLRSVASVEDAVSCLADLETFGTAFVDEDGHRVSPLDVVTLDGKFVRRRAGKPDERVYVPAPITFSGPWNRS